MALFHSDDLSAGTRLFSCRSAGIIHGLEFSSLVRLSRRLAFKRYLLNAVAECKKVEHARHN